MFDGLALSADDMACAREWPKFAIVDEVDDVMLDNAVVPFVISVFQQLE